MAMSKKNVKFVDAIPTIFGLISIAGAVTWSVIPRASDWTYTNFSPMMLYGGGAIALVAAIISVATAIQQSKLSKIHYFNMLWIILPGLFLAWTLLVALTWSRFLGS
jgi:hypothetical protein